MTGGAVQNGAAVVEMTVQAVDQMGVEAVDNCTIPEQPPAEDETEP